MRLGYHYHIPVFNQDGAVYTRGYQGLFLDALAARCERLICFMYSACENEQAELDYKVRAKNISFVDLGRHESLSKRLVKFYYVKKKIKQHQSTLDMMLIRSPTPMLAAISSAAKEMPRSYLIIGDYVKTARFLNENCVKKVLIFAWARWNKMRQVQYTKNQLIFCNNGEILEEYQHRTESSVKVSTALLNAGDIATELKRFSTKPLKILFAGRITAEKGLEDVVDVLGMLVKDGTDAFLDIVGMKEPNDSTMDKVMSKASLMGVEKRIIYHGYKPYGSEYLHFFRQADIYIMASRTYEGFPRTLWDAMASGTPILTTRVGAIEREVAETAFLANPEDPKGLYTKLKEVIAATDTREAKQIAGLKLATHNTLEVQTQKMMDRLALYLRERMLCKK